MSNKKTKKTNIKSEPAAETAAVEATPELPTIKALTDAQVATFPKYVKRWIDIGMSTEPCNVEEATKYAAEAYINAGLTPATIRVGPFNNPIEAALAEHLLVKWSEESRSFGAEGPQTDSDMDLLNKALMDEVANIIASGKIPEGVSIKNQIYGNHEYWLSCYDFFENECGIEACKQLSGLKKLAGVCGWWTPLSNIIILQHRPLEIHMDEQNRIHNLDGAAIKFRGSSDICDVYAIHGIRVDKKVITRDYGVKEILAEQNLEIKRVMIDLFGQEKFLLGADAQVSKNSDDWGTVYSVQIQDDEPLVMVKVVNSTPEPDGTFKDYFIRVDPNAYGMTPATMSGRAAVASTWRNKDGTYIFSTPEEYDPAIQT